MTREYTRYEKARIIGARALQISLGAPTMLKLEEDDYQLDPIDLAIKEFEKSVIPISVIREEEQ